MVFRLLCRWSFVVCRLGWWLSRLVGSFLIMCGLCVFSRFCGLFCCG